MRCLITAMACLICLCVFGQEDEIYEEIVFNYSGGVTPWIVPTGVNLISITLSGAQGGNNPSPQTPLGGLGAIMAGDFSVTPGTELFFLIGAERREVETF